MKLVIAIVLAASLGYASASCVNGCSGHGFCQGFDLCKCYGNWEGTDCSARVCPYTKAWVDTAIASNDAHNYARCGNKGDCSGKDGTCSCYEPFEGKGCRRMACPDGCSGHGTCEYIEELALNNDCAWDATAQATKTNCVHSSIVSSPVYAATAITYTGWDAKKIQGCKCDPGWSGTTCGGRICPIGNDPLRTRNSDDSALQVHSRFDINVGRASGNFATSETTGHVAETFVLAFTDTYNEKWYTRPIPINAVANVGTNAWETYTATVNTAAARNGLRIAVTNALLDLPNAAITGASIDPITGATDSSNSLTVAVVAEDNGTIGATLGNKIQITFKSPHNSGALLNKLECHVAGCSYEGAATTANPGGCSPKYKGITNGICTVAVGVAGTTNADTCSSRGDCDGGSGLCSCHEGYTDEDCSMQTVLV
jgi:hypothetical protein